MHNINFINTDIPMKKIIITCIFSMITLMANAQFLVNNQVPIYDKLSNTYLVSINQDYFDKNYQVQLTLIQDSLWTELSIEGTLVSNDYTFQNIKANKLYQITANKEGKVINSNITFTYLPIIDLKGNFGYDFTQGTVNIYTPNSQESSLIKAKWRGGSTNWYDRHKRNYKIKTLNAEGKSEDVAFLEMRNDNNWILDAGQIDLFRLRNRIATELWNDMATKPYYAEKEPKAMSGVRGKVAEVILNNEYVGIYSLTEALDRKQMKLKKYDSKKEEFHGMLWKASAWSNALFWETGGEFDNNSETWNAFEIKYPDIDDVCPTDYSQLYNAIDFVANSDDETFKTQVADYFDIPVLIDYYIFLEMTNAVDNTGKNMYWAIYDQAKEKNDSCRLGFRRNSRK